MNDLLHWADDKIHTLYGLPGYALVLLSCLVVGMVLKRIQRFPNDDIPAVVCVWGAIFNALVADAEPVGSSHRVWLVRNLLIGLVVGFLAWMFHKAIIKKLVARYPVLQAAFPDCDTVPPFPVDGSRVKAPDSGLAVKPQTKTDI